MSLAIIAAAVSSDLVVGLLLGAAVGFLAGPLVRHGLAFREWAEASREAREARLTDELLFRIEELSEPQEPEVPQGQRPAPQEPEPERDERSVPWRTSP